MFLLLIYNKLISFILDLFKFFFVLILKLLVFFFLRIKFKYQNLLNFHWLFFFKFLNHKNYYSIFKGNKLNFNFSFYKFSYKITFLGYFLLKNNIFIVYINKFIFLSSNIKNKLIYLRYQFLQDGFIYIRGLFIILLIDTLLIDDEPLWEPLEWSLVQTWILFIFIFSWAVENFITSRYGSFTGRDKRVWTSLYKWFWWFEMSFIVSYLLTAVFVITPFYYEITYVVSYIMSWWNWYSRIFFFKFIFLYSLVLVILYVTQLGLRWLNWKKIFFLLIIINLIFGYIIFGHFLIIFFSYFTDPLWYQKTRSVDLIQLSHTPSKWGWGLSDRDHFTYHQTTTGYWYKNDGPYAGLFFMLHFYLFLTIFVIFLKWILIVRRLYTTKELTYTLLTYGVSLLRQFFYFFFLLFFFIILNFYFQFSRLPAEYWWFYLYKSWFMNFIYILYDYPFFLINLII